MTEYITGSLITLIALYLGYCIGKNSSIIPEETRKQVKKIIQALPIDRGLGAVKRPTVQDIKRYENPMRKAEDEAMSETFREIVRP